MKPRRALGLALAACASFSAASLAPGGFVFAGSSAWGAPDDDSSPSITITSVGSPILQPGEDIDVTAVVKNPSSTGVTVTASRLGAQGFVPRSRSTLLFFLKGSGSTGFLSSSTRQIEVPARGSTTLTFHVDRASLGWGDSTSTWGARGIDVAATVDGEKITDRSILVVAPTFEVEKMPVGVVVPVTTPPASSWEFESEYAARVQAAESAISSTDAANSGTDAAYPAGNDADLTGKGSDLTELSASLHTAQPGMTLAVDPALAPRILEPLSSISSISSTEVLLPTGGMIDLAAISHSCPQENGGCTQNFIAMNASHVADAAARIAASTGTAPRTDIAILPATADAGVLEALRVARAGAFVAPADTLEAEERWDTPDARTQVLGTDALLSDTAISAAMSGKMPESAEAAGTQGEAWAMNALDSRQLALGLSATTQRERPGSPRTLMLQIPSLSTEEGKRAFASAGQLLSAPWVSPTTVSAALNAGQGDSASGIGSANGAGSAAGRDSAREDSASSEVAPTVRSEDEAPQAQVLEVSRALEEFSTMGSLSASGPLVTSLAQDRALGLLSSSWASPEERARAVDSFSAQASGLSQGISVNPSSTINVIARRAEIPVTVSSALPFPSAVKIEIQSYDPRLKATKAVPAQLEQYGSAKINIPVEAFGSGNISAKVRVLDQSGNVVGVSRTIDLRIRANWEDRGTLAFLVFFGLLLVVGVVKSLHKGRRSKPISPQEIRRAQKENAAKEASHATS